MKNYIRKAVLIYFVFSCFSGFVSAQNSLKQRINPPVGFKRDSATTKSFAKFLQNLPLKPAGSEVLYFDGQTKPNNNVYEAVVNLNIGTKNLHQCADAVIRLRAEWLWHNGRYEEIHFNFTNGFRCDYAEWAEGKRIVVNGNKTQWQTKYKPKRSYHDFWEYLEQVFTYAGTLSLSKELKAVSITDLKIGDVFIQGGSPGHAVIVVDVAENMHTKEKCFLLAQSYMPAQEIQILKNPNNKKLSPWYSINIGDKLITPEWVFDKMDLKRF